MWGCGVERTTTRECFWRKGEPSPGGEKDLWTKVLRQVLPVPWGRGSCEWDRAGRGEARGGGGATCADVAAAGACAAGGHLGGGELAE